MRARSYVAVCIAFTLLPWLAAAQSTQDAGIFRWDGQRWVQHEGSGTRISVGHDGSPWVVNSRNEIYRWESGAFRRLPGAAKVRGGVWEVCESPGFEGRCLTVSSDVADLASIGLPNFVGSVRPRAGPTPR